MVPNFPAREERAPVRVEASLRNTPSWSPSRDTSVSFLFYGTYLVRARLLFAGHIRQTGIREWWRAMQYIGDAKAGTLVGTDQ